MISPTSFSKHALGALESQVVSTILFVDVFICLAIDVTEEVDKISTTALQNIQRTHVVYKTNRINDN